MTDKDIESILFAEQDKVYRKFHANLIPGIDMDKIIGVRMPTLRKLARELIKDNETEDFLNNLPHKYYDEYNLHGCIVSVFKDYDKTISYINALLPYVDNWATCDLINPTVFKKNKDRLCNDIEIWLDSDRIYTIRFGIKMMMTHFLDDNFDEKYLQRISVIRNDEYYVHMMIAWFFATALAKQWESTIGYIEDKKLNVRTHNKTIQKALESYRISDEQKKYLRTLKV